MDFVVSKNLDDKGTCKARLNSKLFNEHKLLIGEWILAETESKSCLCKAFPLYSSFQSNNVFIDDSICLYKDTKQKKNNQRRFRVERVKYNKTTNITLLNVDEEKIPDSKYLKQQLMGLIVSVGYVLHHKWRILGIKEENTEEISKNKEIRYYVIDEDTSITIEQTETKVEEKKEEPLEEIGGMEKIMEQIEEVALLPIIYSKEFSSLGTEFPKGILICGKML